MSEHGHEAERLPSCVRGASGTPELSSPPSCRSHEHAASVRFLVAPLVSMVVIFCSKITALSPEGFPIHNRSLNSPRSTIVLVKFTKRRGAPFSGLFEYLLLSSQN